MTVARRLDGPTGASASAITRRAVLGRCLGGALLTTPGARAGAQCTLVELAPGYPGYGGNVTGVDGPGDAACVEDLERTDAGFDQAREDAENLAAAGRLGLAGGPNEWTWENWMAVEVEGGLPPTCYACAIRNAPTRLPAPRRAPVRWDDPRLLVGSYGTTQALSLLLAKHGLPPSTFGSMLQYDHELRALTGLVFPGHWSAPQVLDGYDALVTTFGAGGQTVDVPRALDALLTQGGYVPTPPTAHPEDQVFTVLTLIPVLSRFLSPFSASIFVRQCEGIATSWRSDAYKTTSSAPPFATRLREELVGTWLQA